MIVYAAGAEQPWALTALKRAGVRNIFISFYYIPKQKPLSEVLGAIGFPYKVRVMVDSGVFTLCENIRRGKLGQVDFEAYAASYYEWLKENAPYITTAVNLDLEAVVGCKKVDEWNGKHFHDLEKNHGLEIAYVWHKERTRADYIRFCRQYRYIAFSGMLDGSIDLGRVNSWVKKASEYGCKVHGLAFTRWEALKRIGFYSVDSTTWLSGTRYGITAVKHPTAPSMTIFGKDKKDQARKRWRDRITRAGLDFDAILNDNGAAISAHFAKQVHDMNGDIDRLNRNQWYRGGRRDGEEEKG